MFFVYSLHSLCLRCQCTMHRECWIFLWYCNTHECNHNLMLPMHMSLIETHVCPLEWSGKQFKLRIMLTWIFVTQQMIVHSQSILLILFRFNITSAFGVVALLPRFFTNFGKMEKKVATLFQFVFTKKTLIHYVSSTCILVLLKSFQYAILHIFWTFENLY